jgi:hypothetical protein
VRRSPIWQRNGVWYYTAGDGRRISLRTRDRAQALRAYRDELEPPPPPPAAPAAAAPPPPPPPVNSSPPAAEGGGAPPPPANGVDPLLEVGAGTSSSSDSGAPGGGGDDGGGGMPLSEEEVAGAAREMAVALVGLVTMVNGRLALARTGRLGAVQRDTYDRSVTAWLPITRRWALAWEMGPWTAVVLTTFSLCREQWTAENGTVAVDATPAEPPGVPQHASARAQ